MRVTRQIIQNLAGYLFVGVDFKITVIIIVILTYFVIMTNFIYILHVWKGW